jgi:type IV secretion system protein VirD4
VLRADPIRQGRRPGRAVAADLAGLGHRPRHQGRELAADRRLPRAARPRAAVRSDQPKSAAYNPLLEVRRGEWEVRDVQNIADILVDPEGSLEKRNHWEKTSHALLVGAILHVLYAEADKTLAGVAAFLSDPEAPDRDARRDDDDAASRRAGPASRHRQRRARAAQQIRQRALGVLSTAMSFLGLYRDPVVAEVTRAATGASPTSSRRSADDALPRGAAVRHQPHQAADPADPQPDRPPADRGSARQGRAASVLLMLDEFPALGRLDFFESALAFMAGYGLKAS